MYMQASSPPGGCYGQSSGGVSNGADFLGGYGLPNPGFSHGGGGFSPGGMGVGCGGALYQGGGPAGFGATGPGPSGPDRLQDLWSSSPCGEQALNNFLNAPFCCSGNQQLMDGNDLNGIGGFGLVDRMGPNNGPSAMNAPSQFLASGHMAGGGGDSPGGHFSGGQFSGGFMGGAPGPQGSQCGISRGHPGMTMEPVQFCSPPLPNNNSNASYMNAMAGPCSGNGGSDGRLVGQDMMGGSLPFACGAGKGSGGCGGAEGNDLITRWLASSGHQGGCGSSELRGGSSLDGWLAGGGGGGGGGSNGRPGQGYGGPPMFEDEMDMRRGSDPSGLGCSGCGACQGCSAYQGGCHSGCQGGCHGGMAGGSMGGGMPGGGMPGGFCGGASSSFEGGCHRFDGEGVFSSENARGRMIAPLGGCGSFCHGGPLGPGLPSGGGGGCFGPGLGSCSGCCSSGCAGGCCGGSGHGRNMLGEGPPMASGQWDDGLGPDEFFGQKGCKGGPKGGHKGQHFPQPTMAGCGQQQALMHKGVGKGEAMRRGKGVFEKGSGMDLAPNGGFNDGFAFQKGFGKPSFEKGCKDLGTAHSNLFVANLPEDISDAALRTAFSATGAVHSCRVFSRNGRTCGLVKMCSVEEAANAVKHFSFKPGTDPKIRWAVKFAEADVGGGGTMRADGFGPQKGGGKGERRRDGDTSQPSDNLYVKGLVPSITDSQLQSTFARVGKVVEMKILRYPDSKECSALIRMGSVEDAERAVQQLQGTSPEGSVPPLTIRFHGKDALASDNLYVKGLPIHFTQDDLVALFSPCGSVLRCRMLQPPPKHVTTDTAALVQMANAHEAANVIQALSGRVPPGAGPQMMIRFAELKASLELPEQIPTDNVYVKGLPLGTPDFLLRAVFAQFGNVVRMKVLEPKEGEATDCAALVQMSNASEAKLAVEGLNGHMLSAPSPLMRVRFAGKDKQTGSNLYVAGLPITVQEQNIRATFATCGNVLRLRLLQQQGRPETHALVQMASPAEAEQAIQRLNGKPLDSPGPALVVRFATKKGREGQHQGRSGEGDQLEDSEGPDS